MNPAPCVPIERFTDCAVVTWGALRVREGIGAWLVWWEGRWRA